MATKPQGKSWHDAQMAITALSITATLAFWNIFSTPDKTQALAQAEATDTPPEVPAPIEVIEPTAAVSATAIPTAQTLALRPVKIIYGGTLPGQAAVDPAATAVVTANTVPVAQVAIAAPAKKRSGGVSKPSTTKPPSAPKPPKPPKSGSSKP